MFTKTASAVLALVLVGPRASTASHDIPTYNGARYARVRFVRAMTQCLSGPDVHNPPFTFSACTPVPASNVLEFGPVGRGRAHLNVLLNSLHQAIDVDTILDLWDVRDVNTGLGFHGNLIAAFYGRFTDHYCNGVANDPCTVIDFPFPITLPCGTAALPTLAPGRCHTHTSFNAVVSGAIVPGKQMSIGMSQFQVFFGTDLVFEAGIFAP
jgi:hypothetical protein